MDYITGSIIGVTGGVVAGTIAGAIDYWHFQHSLQSIKSNKCKSLIFLEQHSDKGSAQAISGMLNELVNRWYHNYLYEEPADVNYKNTYDAMQSGMSNVLNYMIYNVQAQIKASGINIDAETLKQFMEKSDVPDSIKSASAQYNDFKESYESTLELLETIKNSQGLNIYNIDMPKKMKERFDSKYSVLDDEYLVKRNEFMAEKMEEMCQEGKSKQVLLVGVRHYSIGSILKNKGFDIELYGVFSASPTQEAGLATGLSKKELDSLVWSTYLRVGLKPEVSKHMYLIDLYVNPELKSNYKDIILGTLDREEVLHAGINASVNE